MKRLLGTKKNAQVQADDGKSSIQRAAGNRRAPARARANVEPKALSTNDTTAITAAALAHRAAGNGRGPVGAPANVERETPSTHETTTIHAATLAQQAAGSRRIPVKARANVDPETPLVYETIAIRSAVLCGNVDALAQLVGRVDIGSQDSIGWTVLHCAATKENVKVMELLLGPRTNVDQLSQKGHTPLRIAAALGHSATVKYLLSLGSNPNYRSPDGSRPIHLAAQNNHSLVVEHLLQAGANPEYKTADGRTPLTLAEEDGHVAVVERLLRWKAGVLMKSPEGLTLLPNAVASGHYEIAELLLGLGADPNVPKDNVTALHVAASRGPLSIVKALLKAKADPDLVGLNGKTPLHFAAQKGNLEAVRRLVEAGADIEAISSDGRTPAHYAAGEGKLAVVQELSNAGANLEARAAQGGYSLIHTAVSGGNLAVVEFILERGVSVHAVADGGMTALHFAGLNLAITKRLLEAGVDPSSRTDWGNSAFDLAQAGGHPSVARLLGQYETPDRPIPRFVGYDVLPQQVAQTDDELLVTTTTSDPEIAAALAAVNSWFHGRKDLERNPRKTRIQYFANDEQSKIFLGQLPKMHGKPAYNPVKVPLLVDPKILDQDFCDPDFDFMSLPGKKGWKIVEENSRPSSIERLDGSQYGPLDLATFIQELLFFGVLKAISRIIGFDFACGDVIRKTRSGENFLFTDGIPVLLTRWSEAEQKMRMDVERLMEVAVEPPFSPKFPGQALRRRLAPLSNLLLWADHVARVVFERKDIEAPGANTVTSTPQSTATTTSEIARDAAVKRKPLPTSKTKLEIDRGISARRKPMATAERSLETSCADDLLGINSMAIIILDDILTKTRERLYSPGIRLECDKHSRDSKTGSMAREFERSDALVEDYIGPLFFNFSCRFTYQKMLTLKWCPSEANMLHSTGIRTGALYFMTLLSRPMMAGDHIGCTKFHCQTMQVNTRHYKTQHASGCRECNVVKVNTSTVEALLREGHIPVVQVAEDRDTNTVSLRVCRATDSAHECRGRMDYVALSHVWAHGLGNPKENSLPTCQLRRLKNIVLGVRRDNDARIGAEGMPIGKDGPFFWIDTLCVPVKSKIGRKRALGLLGKAYRDARFTAVIDKELLATPSSRSPAERAARVLSSAWIRRLWTLEEAVLGLSGLHYQFYNKALLHGGDVGGHKEKYHDFVAAMYSTDLVNVLRDLVPIAMFRPGHKLISLLASCCWRTTSKDLDQVTCLASVLDLEVGKILSIYNEDSAMTLQERMCMFYKLLGDSSRTDEDTRGIPIHILFMDGPRLTSPGFSWAPASFLQRSPSNILSYHVAVEPGFLTPDGLRLQMDGWILDISDDTSVPLSWFALWGKSFAFEDEENSIAFAIVLYGEEWKTSYPYPGELEGRKIALLRPTELAPHALIVLVEREEEDCIFVSHHGWRVRANDWTIEEFRTRHDLSQGDYTYDGMKAQGDKPTYVKGSQDLYNWVSVEGRWRQGLRLYNGKRSKTRNWVIL